MLFSAAILASLTAAAADGQGSPGFPRKTMHGELPQREVLRELVLPRGWISSELALDSKTSAQFRARDGKRRSYDDGTRWSYSRAWLRIEQGFSDRVTLYMYIPWVQARLNNPLGPATRTRALGDVHTGWRFQPQLGGQGKLAFQLDLKAPSGVEWARGLNGGPNQTSGFLTGTGITDLGGSVLVADTFGQWLRLEGELAYVFSFPSVVGYVTQPDGFGHGWLDPGDMVRLSAGVSAQLQDNLTLGVDSALRRRATFRTGTSGRSAFRTDLHDIPGTASLFVDLGGDLSWRVHPLIDLRAGASWQAYGTDTRPWSALGLEDFSPQPGLSVRGSVVKRW